MGVPLRPPPACLPLEILSPTRRARAMAAVSDQLVWELVKKHNAFTKTNLHGRIFSAEPTTMKKDMRRMARALTKEVEGFRPDLKKAALAKLSAAQKSLRVIKAGPKKK